jgi:DNA repair protein RecN (Recombination protein N)
MGQAVVQMHLQAQAGLSRQGPQTIHLAGQHLAQLAGYGDKHYHVKKLVRGDRTSTQVNPLDDEAERVNELAEMLGAQGESGKVSARDILHQAQEYKQHKQPRLI